MQPKKYLTKKKFWSPKNRFFHQPCFYSICILPRSLLFLLNVFKFLDVHPFWWYDTAFLLLAQVYGKPQWNVNGHACAEWTNAARYQMNWFEREVWNDADDAVLAYEL